MYNGIGLKTARGSGTNGFVQRNISYVRPSKVLEFTQRTEPQIIEPKQKNQDKSILEHQVKREIEVALMELEDKMEEQGYSKEEILKRVGEERKMRNQKLHEKVNGIMEKRMKQEEGADEELHDFGGEDGKKVWMEGGKKEEKPRRSKRRSYSRSYSRSRSRSHSNEHRHHHGHDHRHRS